MRPLQAALDKPSMEVSGSTGCGKMPTAIHQSMRHRFGFSKFAAYRSRRSRWMRRSMGSSRSKSSWGEELLNGASMVQHGLRASGPYPPERQQNIKVLVAKYQGSLQVDRHQPFFKTDQPLPQLHPGSAIGATRCYQKPG